MQRDKQQAAQPRKVPAGSPNPTLIRSYKAKVVGGFSDGWDHINDTAHQMPGQEDSVDQTAAEAEQEDPDARNARLLAEARKERLLEFDRTSARRTRVIGE